MVLRRVEALLDQPLTAWQQPPYGADHLVLLATTGDGQDVVVKAGTEADVDAYVLQQLQRVHAPVPTILTADHLVVGTDSYPMVIMTRVAGQLLAEVADPRDRYLRSLTHALATVHSVTTTKGAGPVLEVERGSRLSWTDYLRRVVSGDDPEFWWDAIQRQLPRSHAVISAARARLLERMERLDAPAHLSLLHGDLNPANIFVDRDRVTGLIDWSYARFGDPLFDFARLRMNPFVRSHPLALKTYFDLLQLTPAERAREQTYYVFNLLEYVNWYFQEGSVTLVDEHLALIEAAIG